MSTRRAATRPGRDEPPAELTEPYLGQDGEVVYPPGYTDCIADPVEDALQWGTGAGRVVQVGTGDNAQTAFVEDDEPAPRRPYRVMARVTVRSTGARVIRRASGCQQPPSIVLAPRARSGLAGGRPRGQRRSSSRSAGGGDPDSDGGEPGERPRLVLAPRPAAVLTFGVGERGA